LNSNTGLSAFNLANRGLVNTTEYFCKEMDKEGKIQNNYSSATAAGIDVCVAALLGDAVSNGACPYSVSPFGLKPKSGEKPCRHEKPEKPRHNPDKILSIRNFD